MQCLRINDITAANFVSRIDAYSFSCNFKLILTPYLCIQSACVSGILFDFRGIFNFVECSITSFFLFFLIYFGLQLLCFQEMHQLHRNLYIFRPKTCEDNCLHQYGAVNIQMNTNTHTHTCITCIDVQTNTHLLHA